MADGVWLGVKGLTACVSVMWFVCWYKWKISAYGARKMNFFYDS